MPVSAWISSTVIPSARARAMAKMRSGVGIRSASPTSSNCEGVRIEPGAPMSSMRSAFWITSGKVRPMAMTSPTLFISLPMRVDAPRNLPRSQRGTLQTM